jgi:GR25 family glycosyltransferase involved in LPS biosynthesis
MNNLINKIFVINLEHSVDRKQHIIAEFKKNNINNYDFFKGVCKDDEQVVNLMDSDFVETFPPCFRCHQDECKCINNILINTQIGNWCSFINLMKHIDTNKFNGLIMICEDDIKFTDRFNEIFKELLNDKTFKKYDIDQSKPLILRCGSGFSDDHNIDVEPILTTKIIMSNPCFIINHQFANLFLLKLEKITCTSDMFIHATVSKTIQNFTMIPQPIYELSSNKGNKAEFVSDVIPKGINEQDRERVLSSCFKKEIKEFLLIGHPRCGTSFAAGVFNQIGWEVGHENMKEDGISSWMLCVDSEHYPWGNIGKNNPLQSFYFKNVIHVVRDPFKSIPSIILENKYPPQQKSYTFRRQYIKKILNIDLPDTDFIDIDFTKEIEIAVMSLICWHKICELNNPVLTIKIEDTLEVCKRFTKSDKNIDFSKIKRNSNKLYNGKHYDKPKILLDDFRSLSNNIKDDLKEFCLKYDYKYIL